MRGSRAKASVTIRPKGVSAYVGVDTVGEPQARAVFNGLTQSDAAAASGRTGRAIIDPGLVAAGLAHCARLDGTRVRQDTRLDLDETLDYVRRILEAQRAQQPEVWAEPAPAAD